MARVNDPGSEGASDPNGRGQRPRLQLRTAAICKSPFSPPQRAFGLSAESARGETELESPASPFRAALRHEQLRSQTEFKHEAQPFLFSHPRHPSNLSR